MIPTLIGFRTGLNAPPAPQLSYTAEGQFTIINYSSTIFYEVSGATRTNDILSSISNGATIRAAYSVGAPLSNSSLMNVAINTRVLTTVATNITDTGCGPRPNLCCPGGTIQNTSGAVCGGSPGSVAPDNFCGNTCDPGNCFQLTVTCWNWRWTNYSTGPDGTGYTLIGNIWGKATNG